MPLVMYHSSLKGNFSTLWGRLFPVYDQVHKEMIPPVLSPTSTTIQHLLWWSGKLTKTLSANISSQPHKCGVQWHTSAPWTNSAPLLLLQEATVLEQWDFQKTRLHEGKIRARSQQNAAWRHPVINCICLPHQWKQFFLADYFVKWTVYIYCSSHHNR